MSYFAKLSHTIATASAASPTPKLIRPPLHFMLFYIDHCKNTIREQINVLGLYLREIEVLDYEFIRNQALGIYQFSDHVVSGPGNVSTGGDKIITLDSQFLLSESKCIASVRDQIELLSRYLSDNEFPDYTFVRTHAGYLIQLCDQLNHDRQSGHDLSSNGQRTSRCTPSA